MRPDTPSASNPSVEELGVRIMSWVKRSVLALLTAGAAVSVSACAPEEDSGEAAASCAYVVTFEGRTYQDVANVKFTVGDELGTATQPPCDDTGGRTRGEEPAATRTVAYAVEGISPTVAIAVQDAPDDVMFVAVPSGRKLPAEVEKLIVRPS
jgi:hypothetical protein